MIDDGACACACASVDNLKEEARSEKQEARSKKIGNSVNYF